MKLRGILKENFIHFQKFVVFKYEVDDNLKNFCMHLISPSYFEPSITIPKVIIIHYYQ